MNFKHLKQQINVPDDRANGAAIRRRRLNAGVSLRCLADAMGYTPSYQSDMELGKRSLSMSRFAQMVAFLEAKR